MYLCPARPCCRYVTGAQTSKIGLSGWGGICCSNLILGCLYHQSVWGGKWVLYSIYTYIYRHRCFCRHVYLLHVSTQTAPEKTHVRPLEVPPCTLSLVVPTRLSQAHSSSTAEHAQCSPVVQSSNPVQLSSPLFTDSLRVG